MTGKVDSRPTTCSTIVFVVLTPNLSPLKSDAESPVVSVAEAAVLTNRSEQSVRRWIKEGRVEALKFRGLREWLVLRDSLPLVELVDSDG